MYGSRFQILMNQDIIISDKKDVELTDYERRVGKGEVEERRVSHPFCVGCVMLKIFIMHQPK